MKKARKSLYYQYIIQWTTFFICMVLKKNNREYQEFYLTSALMLHCLGYFFYIFKIVSDLLKKAINTEITIPEQTNRIMYVFIAVNFWAGFVWYIICTIFNSYFPPVHFFASSLQFVFFSGLERDKEESIG